MHSNTGASAAPIDTFKLVFEPPAPKFAEAVVPFGLVVDVAQGPVGAQVAAASTISKAGVLVGVDNGKSVLVALNV